MHLMPHHLQFIISFVTTGLSQIRLSQAKTLRGSGSSTMANFERENT